MTRTAFGTTQDGGKVERITLDNGVLSVSVLTLGATLQDVRLAGLNRPLTLGSDQVADYEPDGALKFFGSVAGPVANRIRNARAPLDGATVELEPTAAGGHSLHGGTAGLSRKIWQVESATPDRLVLSTRSPHGEGGYPGNRRFEAMFSLGEGADLSLTMTAETDAPTFVNLANHSYWNLAATDHFHGHLLQIGADHYLPTDDTALVTGEIRAVDGTPFDFRTARALTAEDVLDHNFCLSQARTDLRPILSLTSADGVRLAIETTEPGVQVYDARHLPADGVAGHDGRRYGPRSGLAIEAQYWPDAPNHPDFPSVRLAPGEPWQQTTRFRFSRI